MEEFTYPKKFTLGDAVFETTTNFSFSFFVSLLEEFQDQEKSSTVFEIV